MGNLKPGASYVYERVGTVTYAREFGSEPDTRVAIGWDYDPNDNAYTSWAQQFTSDHMWKDIMVEAKRNPALQEALDRVKIVYYLSKEKQQPPPDWHPV